MSRLTNPEINFYNGGSPIFQDLINLQLSMFYFHHWDHVMEVLQRIAPSFKFWRFLMFVDCFCSFFTLSVAHKSYFCICFAVFRRQNKLEIPKFCSWMHFISPHIMCYKLSRLGRWTSICKIYFAECTAFRGHADQQDFFI